jgi:hypothetical protein
MDNVQKLKIVIKLWVKQVVIYIHVYISWFLKEVVFSFFCFQTTLSLQEYKVQRRGEIIHIKRNKYKIICHALSKKS